MYYPEIKIPQRVGLREDDELVVNVHAEDHGLSVPRYVDLAVRVIEAWGKMLVTHAHKPDIEYGIMDLTDIEDPMSPSNELTISLSNVPPMDSCVEPVAWPYQDVAAIEDSLTVRTNLPNLVVGACGFNGISFTEALGVAIYDLNLILDAQRNDRTFAHRADGGEWKFLEMQV